MTFSALWIPKRSNRASVRRVMIVFVSPAAAAALLSSCATPNQDEPLHAIYQHHVEAIENSFATNAGDPFTTSDKLERNKRIRQLIFLIDRSYEARERRLFDHNSAADFVGSVSVLGLNSAGAVTGGTEAKAILAAISGGIVGTKTAFDKDILQGQTTLAIIAKMREQRSAKLTPLLTGMKESPDDYTMEQAIVDLGEYYNAGTVTVALQDIIASSAKEKVTSDQANLSLKTNRQITTTTTTKGNGVINKTESKQ